jgi:hypothetical protein
MDNIDIKFMENLNKKLISDNEDYRSYFYDSFSVRAKGYYNFFGPKALPFGADDFFSYFMLAKYKEKPFFTVKYCKLSTFKDYNLKNPIENLLSKDQHDDFMHLVPHYKNMGWSGGFTYLLINELGKKDTGEIAKDLSAYFLYYCLINYTPDGLILTANLKAKVDRYLLKCGFDYINIDQVIHPELNNNPAKFLILKKPSNYMINCYNKYNKYNNTNIDTYIKEVA